MTWTRSSPTLGNPPNGPFWLGSMVLGAGESAGCCCRRDTGQHGRSRPLDPGASAAGAARGGEGVPSLSRRTRYLGGLTDSKSDNSDNLLRKVHFLISSITL